MAVFAASITKGIPWRGGVAPVSNVYHYKTLPGESFLDNALIDELVRAEKLIYGNTVSFLKARTWGPTENGPTASKMREVRELSGFGSAQPTGSLYGELAVMVYWPLGRYGTRNRPQYLRKWMHLMRTVGLPSDGSRYGGVIPPDILQYTKDVESAFVQAPAVRYALTTWDGEHDAPVNGGQMYRYLEHRQIGK